MANNPNHYALVHRYLAHPERQLNYNQVYKIWGYPTKTLPYRQINRMLRNPAIKYPYNQFPKLIKQQQLARQKQYQQINHTNNQLPYDTFNKEGARQQPNPFNQHQQTMDRFAKDKSEKHINPDNKQQQDNDSSQQQQTEQKNQQPKQPKPSSKAMISFDKLSVGTISSSSGVFNGKNIQFGWSSHSKTNTGFGTLGGHNNRVNRNTNVVFDNDQIDTPIDDRDTMWSPVPTA